VKINSSTKPTFHLPEFSKSEMYYIHKFGSYNELKIAIEDYIDYYNRNRIQEQVEGILGYYAKIYHQ
jgi:hypothetical protein